MALFPDTLKELAMMGANIEIIDDTYFPDTLKDVVRIAASHGGHVTISAANIFPDTLKELALIGKGHITFRV